MFVVIMPTWQHYVNFQLHNFVQLPEKIGCFYFGLLTNCELTIVINMRWYTFYGNKPRPIRCLAAFNTIFDYSKTI